jgi:hypothetical protein
MVSDKQSLTRGCGVRGASRNSCGADKNHHHTTCSMLRTLIKTFDYYFFVLNFINRLSS